MVLVLAFMAKTCSQDSFTSVEIERVVSLLLHFIRRAIEF